MLGKAVSVMLVKRWSDRDENLGPVCETSAPNPPIHSDDLPDEKYPLAAPNGIFIAIVISLIAWAFIIWAAINLLA